MKPAVIANPWSQLRRHTPARIALGRSGASLPTAPHLAFQLAHARARDAVHHPFDIDATATAIEVLGLATTALHSAAADRAEYLQRPDLGRRLDAGSAASLDALAAGSPAPAEPLTLTIVVADGLSALAVERHAPPFIAALLAELRRWPMLSSTSRRVGEKSVTGATDVADASGATDKTGKTDATAATDAADATGTADTAAVTAATGTTDATYATGVEGIRGIDAHVRSTGDALPNTADKDGWRHAPVCLVREGRVAIGDEIGGRLGAALVVVLIGERPGLSSPDSMGCYLTWAPRVGRSDAERNCISNIRAEGLPPAAAAARAAGLVRAARHRCLSGVALKDESMLPAAFSIADAAFLLGHDAAHVAESGADVAEGTEGTEGTDDGECTDDAEAAGRGSAAA